MQLEWMGDYRDVVEKLMKYCNLYAAVYNKELPHGTDIPFSYAQIQVVEYLLENEELNQNMSTIADRLGITYSTFSKLVNKLVKKEFLEKFHVEGNRKNIIIRVTETGKRIYNEYTKFICENHFFLMFAAADPIPRKYLPYVAEMLDAGCKPPEKVAGSGQESEEKPPVLIPVDDKK